MPFSFWEYNHYQNQMPFIIIGGGIVGLSTAIEIKIHSPRQEVLIVEKYFPPTGASTKNAGFACFGSITEIIDDLSCMTRNEVIEIVKMRWQGIQILTERLGSKNIKINLDGGHELFNNGEYISDENFALCNEIMREATGVKDYFKHDINNDFNLLNTKCISMKSEGELNAMEMLYTLQQIAIEKGIKFIFGHSLINIHHKNKTIDLSENISLRYDKLFICTNGFARSMFPEIEVTPARNHVLMTGPIEEINWKGVYHFDKGYYYFRRVGNRILLGGARNFDSSNEYTSEFEFNEKIRQELKRFLKEVILSNHDVNIDYWWTGVLGVGKSKYPILTEIEKDCFVGVRLGGMGVAIGSLLGRKLVELSM